MPAINIRDMPDDLFRALKIFCLDEEMTQNDGSNRLLEYALHMHKGMAPRRERRKPGYVEPPAFTLQKVSKEARARYVEHCLKNNLHSITAIEHMFRLWNDHMDKNPVHDPEWGPAYRDKLKEERDAEESQ